MVKHTTNDLLSLFLAKQICFHLAKQKEGMLQGTVAIPTAWKELDAELSQASQELEDQGKYYYSGDESVFTDYKKLKNSVVPEGGMQKLASRFSIEMTKDELLEEAKAVIEEWLSISGRERKAC